MFQLTLISSQLLNIFMYVHYDALVDGQSGEGSIIFLKLSSFEPFAFDANSSKCHKCIVGLKGCDGGRDCLGAEGVLRVSFGCFVSLTRNLADQEFPYERKQEGRLVL